MVSMVTQNINFNHKRVPLTFKTFIYVIYAQPLVYTFLHFPHPNYIIFHSDCVPPLDDYADYTDICVQNRNF